MNILEAILACIGGLLILVGLINLVVAMVIAWRWKLNASL